MIFVDDVPLDELLAKLEPDSEPEGLVPAWLPWLVDEAEQAVVWERMMPQFVGNVAVPILVCPDDLDFSCSLVIADLEAQPDRILWRRMGFDSTQSTDPARVGEDVDWFGRMPVLTFRRNDYEECVRAFREEAGNQ
jgi:hypothetical protein